MNILRVKVKNFKEQTGTLIPIDHKNIKIREIKRVFFIKQKNNTFRGKHAHKKCTQVFFQIKGKSELKISTKNKINKIQLNETKKFAYVVKPKNWIELRSISKNSITAVFCDRYYEKKDYIYKFNQI